MHAVTGLAPERAQRPAVLGRVLVDSPPAPEGASVAAAAAALAQLAGARLAAVDGGEPRARRRARSGPPEHASGSLLAYAARRQGADVVAIAGSRAAGSGLVVQRARSVLDAGICVLIVPPLRRGPVRLARIGVGYDGSEAADGALAIASSLAGARRGQIDRFEIVHVDGSASFEWGADGDVLDARRATMIHWWLEQVGRPVPAPLRVTRAVGDPAAELTRVSADLDLLAVGSRGRAPLRRALTGSATNRLVAGTRCPLLIVPRA